MLISQAVLFCLMATVLIYGKFLSCRSLQKCLQISAQAMAPVVAAGKCCFILFIPFLWCPRQVYTHAARTNNQDGPRPASCLLGGNINYIIAIAAASGPQQSHYFIFTSNPNIYFHSIGNLFFYPVDCNSKLPCTRENASSIMLYFKSIFFFKITLMLLSLFF